MNITTNLEKLKKVISLAEKITGKNNDLPILSSLLLETEKGLLKISATNLELGIILKIGAKIEKNGKIAVPAKIINNFINNFNFINKIQLKSDEKFLNISSNNNKTKIKIISNDDFPIIPQTKKEFLFKIKADILREIINKLNISVSNQDTRLEFTGVNIIFKDNYLELASTDSFRLSKIIIDLNNKEKGSNYKEIIEKKETLIIPFNTLLEINRIIDNNCKEIEFITDQNQIFIKFDNDILLTSRLINGKYPDYSQIIPQKFNTKVNIDKNSLLQAIRLALVFNNKGELNLKIDNKKNQLIINSQEQEIGENKTILEADIQGDNQDIVFNSKYLLDGISVVDSDIVNLKIIDSDKPIIITESNNKKNNFEYILMPIKK